LSLVAYIFSKRGASLLRRTVTLMSDMMMSEMRSALGVAWHGELGRVVPILSPRAAAAFTSPRERLLRLEFYRCIYEWNELMLELRRYLEFYPQFNCTS